MEASHPIYAAQQAFKQRLAEASTIGLSLSTEEYHAMIEAQARECETQEGIKKVESFQKLQAQMVEIARRDDQELMKKIVDLSFDYLDHPLTTVAAIAKSMLKKVMQA